MSLKDRAIELTPTPTSSASQWIQWHTAVRKLMGRSEANVLFLEAWDKYGGGENGLANTSSLRSYMNGQGIEIESSGFARISDFVGGILNVAKKGAYVIIIGFAIYVVAKQGIKLYNQSKGQ